MIKALPAAEQLLHWQDFFGGPTRVLGGSHDDLDLLVLDAPHLFARPGNPYVTPAARIGPTMACGLPRLREWRPKSAKEPSHHSCLKSYMLTTGRQDFAPAYLHYGHRPRPATVMTVHNLAYQGKFPHRNA